ncbi:uncharacterized protein [Miscanthus floridulus]|uniref:uncharacterized protein n=1 Tax=Miscanthus floridulus TaxID=154761 RepID=UPI0034580189
MKAVPLGSTTTAPPPQGRAAAGIHNRCDCPAHPRSTSPSSITDPAKTPPPLESSLASPAVPPVNLGLRPDRCIPRIIKSPPAIKSPSALVMLGLLVFHGTDGSSCREQQKDHCS